MISRETGKEDVLMNRYRGGRRRRMLALTLALTLVFSASLFSSAAFADETNAPVGNPLDLTKPCGMTVQPTGDDTQKADLAAEGTPAVVVDLYQVAGAEKTPGIDSYNYTLLDPYKALATELENVRNAVDGASWAELSQKVMAIALTRTPDKAGQPVNMPIENLAPGLYLILARSEDLTAQENYVLEHKQIVLDEQNKKTTKVTMVTLAHSALYDYTFAPQLISLPTKTEAVDESGQTVISTAYGAWVYTPTVVLKPEQNPRMGDLEIVKNLATYVGPEPATFVFQVEARWTNPKTGEQETVYSDVAVITFTEPGQKVKLIEGKIPVNAEVTVTESYSGAHYKVTTPKTQTVTIRAATQTDGQTIRTQAVFTNDFDNTNTGGHGIVNHFTYTEGTGGMTWYLEQRSGAEAES